MAYDHLFWAILAHGPFLHQCAECLCRTSSIFLAFFSNICSIPFIQFANVHDISWGTKGDNAPPLGTVTPGTAAGKAGSNQVIADVPTDEKDIDELYQDAVYVLQTKRSKEKKKVDDNQKKEDYYKNFRTK